MVSQQASIRPRVAVALAAALAAGAGFADAVTYLRWHVFSANMTGNAVIAAIALADRRAAALGFALMPVGAFLAGCFVARLAADRVPRAGALGGEAALLALAAAAHDSPLQIALVACAMGVQNTIVDTFDGVGANTSFVTGDVNKIGAATAGLFRASKRAEARRTLGVLVPLIGAYVAGAAGAVALTAAHGANALVYVLPLVLACAWAIAREPRAASAG